MAYEGDNQSDYRRREATHFAQSGQAAPHRRATRRQAQPQQASYDAQENPYSRQHAGGYYSSANVRNYNQPSPMRFAPVIFAVVLIVALGFVVWNFIIHPASFEIYLNGEQMSVHRGDTVTTLVEKQYATPTPGNLVAVDGSVLAEGQGTPFTATIDDQPAEPNTKLALGNHVVIENGTDITEEADTTETEVPYQMIDFERSFAAYWAGSIHLLLKGQNGIQTNYTGKQSGKTISQITQEPVNGGFRVYTVQTSDPVIALTFDDGPWPETTDQILDLLEQYGAKATFFTIGNQISEHTASVQRAYNMGCQICTHSWDHADGSGQGVNLTYMSAQEQLDELLKGYQAITDAIGVEPSRVMRAPGGNFYGDIIDNYWNYLDAEIGWDVDTEDWARPGSDEIYARIMSVTPGQVILMHDGGGDRSQTVEALSRALPELVAKGYRFVTVDELLAYGLPE